MQAASAGRVPVVSREAGPGAKWGFIARGSLSAKDGMEADFWVQAFEALSAPNGREREVVRNSGALCPTPGDTVLALPRLAPQLPVCKMGISAL